MFRMSLKGRGFIGGCSWKQPPTDEPAGHDRTDLTGRRRHDKGAQRRSHCKGRPLAIRAQATGHTPNRLGDDSDRHDLEAV